MKTEIKTIIRTPEEFEDQHVKLGLKDWPIHNCSLCGYQCGYLFREGEVYYDSGCDCVSYINIRKLSWDEVAEQYNIQTHPDVIARYDDYWQFEKSEA